MAAQANISEHAQAQPSRAAANRGLSEGRSLPAVEAEQQVETEIEPGSSVINGLAADTPFQLHTSEPGLAGGADQSIVFQALLQRKKNGMAQAGPVQFVPDLRRAAASRELTAPATALEPIATPASPALLDPDTEYEEHFAPGMKLLTGAKMAGEAGIAGAKKSGELALAGADKSMDLAGRGMVRSGELAWAGADKSADLGIAGAEKSLGLAGEGIVKSGKLGLSGIKASGKLGLKGAKKSLGLAASGMEASAAFAAAPARWAEKGAAGTKSKFKKRAYQIAGAAGTLVSAPLGLVGAIGSGALGAAGAVGSGVLGAAGAIGSGALGAAGAVGSGALGLAGATGSAALGTAGVVGSAALGAAGVVGSGVLGAAGVAGSGAAGLTGAALAGTAGLAGATTAGALGGVGMLGGGAVEGGKYVGGLAKDSLNKELIGEFKPGASHPEMGDQASRAPASPGEFQADGQRINYGAMSKKEGAQYGMMGLGGASTVGASITDMASKGNVVGNSIAQNNFTSPLAGGAEAFGGLAAGAGVLGAGAALVDAGGAAKEAADSSNDSSSRKLAAGQALSGVADATKSVASSAYNIAGLVDAKGAAAAGAQIAAGGAAIATGAIDIIRGGYGIHTADKRAELLEGIARGAEIQASIMEGLGNAEAAKAERAVINIARDAKATQERAKVAAGGQVAKGAIAVAGGILLAASMATPIGWMILGAGAAVGIGVAIANWWSKRSKKKEVVMRELGVTDQMAAHQKKIEKIEAATSKFSKARRDQLAALEKENPLKNKLKEFGFTSVGHCYTNYMNATANKLFQSGVVNQKKQYEDIISSIGLKIERKGVDPNGWKPTPEKISKALTGG